MYFLIDFVCLKKYDKTILTAEVSALAMTRNTPATSEFEIHILDPLIKKCSPSFLAVVFSEKASDPERGSVKQKLPA